MTNSPAVIRVAIPAPLPEAFDYLWTLGGPPPPAGSRVRVPFGNGERIGVVLEHASSSEMDPTRLKAVTESLDAEPILGADLLDFLLWCANYYHYPIGEVVSNALPSLLRRGRSAAAARETGWRLTEAGSAVDTRSLRPRARRQARALELASAHEIASRTLYAEHEVGLDVLSRLTEKGWLEATDAPPERRTPGDPAPGTASEPELTQDQCEVLETIFAYGSGYRPFLLQGVTGSGKTEVYLRLITRELAEGRQSLLLVPEIGLTPQLARRLTERLGGQMALMHSGLTDRERLEAWRDASTGAARLIVGTRSAIFAPLPDPGAIIVDEEHDPSYKQQDGFKYSARDLAVYRARQLGVPVILASATPSLESIHNAREGRYESLSMPRRIGSSRSPSLQVVDLARHEVRNGLSTPLIAAIERHLGNDTQVLLFLNRRGFAPVLFCAECRVAEECTRCDARMTIHSASGQLRCHHCGTRKALAWRCANCGAERVAVGAGTQRVTDELAALFPDASIARLDRDVTNRKGALADVLADVEHGDTQILVGTQMLTKGHDFPRVTLVGVLNADQGLLGADFRSSERLAQTLLQVAGRAGRRDHPGEVYIQTHFPSHPLLDCLIDHDYTAFAGRALAERQAAGWPPYSHLAIWRARAKSRDPATRFLRRIAERARANSAEVTTLGPAPAAMERRGGQYRVNLLLHSIRRAPLHALISDLLTEARKWPEARRLRWSIDVDPIEL